MLLLSDYLHSKAKMKNKIRTGSTTYLGHTAKLGNHLAIAINDLFLDV